MDQLEELFLALFPQRIPDTPNDQEYTRLEHILLERVRADSGEPMVEKLTDFWAEKGEADCRRFFQEGLRLGLELVRLL